MVNPSRILMENTLKSSFHFILYIVNEYGEEKELIFKKTKKKFFSEINLDDCTVKLVNDYPPREMEISTFYIKKSGKTMWVKEREK